MVTPSPTPSGRRSKTTPGDSRPATQRKNFIPDENTTPQRSTSAARQNGVRVQQTIPNVQGTTTPHARAPLQQNVMNIDIGALQGQMLQLESESSHH